MAIEQGAADDPDRTIMLIDCGLMFPDANMHGVDLILPDFTYLRENAQRHLGDRAHPRPRGPRRRHPVPAARPRRHRRPARRTAADLRRSAHARPRPQPHRGSRPAAEDRHAQGRRRRAASRSARSLVEFIPVTHSVPHAHAIAVHTAQGVVLHSGDYKIDLTPVDSSPHRPRPHRPARQGPGHPTADGRLDQRRRGRLLAERDQRRLACSPGCSPQHRDRRIVTASFASHLHRIQQIADAAIADGRKVATLGLSMKKNVRLGLELKVLEHPRVGADRHRGHRQVRTRRDLHHLHRVAGRADVGARADGARREQVAQAGRTRHGRAVESCHPRQRGQRQRGDRRADPHGRRGRALRVHGRARHRPRPGRRDQDLPVDRQPRVVRADPRRVPPHGRQRQARRADGRAARPGRSSARTATCSN